MEYDHLEPDNNDETNACEGCENSEKEIEGIGFNEKGTTFYVDHPGRKKLKRYKIVLIIFIVIVLMYGLQRVLFPLVIHDEIESRALDVRGVYSAACSAHTVLEARKDVDTMTAAAYDVALKDQIKKLLGNLFEPEDCIIAYTRAEGISKVVYKDYVYDIYYVNSKGSNFFKKGTWVKHI